MIRRMKKENEREDGKQKVESRRESSNTQHERMDGMKWSARHTLFLSQCQCDIKSVVNQRENVTCEVCCSQGVGSATESFVEEACCIIASSNCIEGSPGSTWKSQTRNIELIPFEVVVPPCRRWSFNLVENLLVASHVACAPKQNTESENTWFFAWCMSIGLTLSTVLFGLARNFELHHFSHGDVLLQRDGRVERRSSESLPYSFSASFRI